MRYDTFLKLFDTIIKPGAKELIEDYSTQRIYLEFHEDCKKAIFENYIILCAHLRKHYMGEKDGEDGTIKANRHKVAACFTVATVMAHPITFANADDEEKRNVHIANEYLGLMTGLGIVNSMIKAVDKNWPEADGFDVPQYGGNRKPFLDELAIGLHNSIRALSIDLMAISNIFALIEEYTIEKRHYSRNT